MPVYLDGNVIDLGVYMLQVAEACSGLRYLFPIMSFTYVFAVLYRGPLWHKLVLLLLAVPIAVLMNAVRIGIIGLLVDRYGIAQAEGFLHVFEGWVVFLSCIAILFLHGEGDAAAGRRPPAARRGARARLLRPRRRSSRRRPRRCRPRGRWSPPALMTAALGARLEPGAGARGGGAAARALRALPARDRRLAGHARAARRPAIERVLGADDYLSAFYRKPGEAEGVDLFLSYYRQPDRRQRHPLARGLPARRRLGGRRASSR